MKKVVHGLLVVLEITLSAGGNDKEVAVEYDVMLSPGTR